MIKLDGKGYRLIPECEVQSILFEECIVDLIGPWIVQVHDKLYEFDTLTVINTVTNLVELIRVDDKKLRYHRKKVCTMLVIRLPLATKMCT